MNLNKYIRKEHIKHLLEYEKWKCKIGFIWEEDTKEKVLKRLYRYTVREYRKTVHPCPDISKIGNILYMNLCSDLDINEAYEKSKIDIKDNILIEDIKYINMNYYNDIVIKGII